MKRRVRPLEEGERELVEAGTWMEVDLVHDAVDYALRWQGTPLARVINASIPDASTNQQRYRKAVAASNHSQYLSQLEASIATASAAPRKPGEETQYGAPIRRPSGSQPPSLPPVTQQDGAAAALAGVSLTAGAPSAATGVTDLLSASQPPTASVDLTSAFRAVGGGEESVTPVPGSPTRSGGIENVFIERACFTLPDEWLEPLGLNMFVGDDLCSVEDASWELYDALCTATVSIEASVATAWVRMDASLRSMLTLRQVMERVAHNWQLSAPDLVRRDKTLCAKLEELWCAAREASRAATRPWGRPLAPEFFISHPRDEHFLPNLSASSRAAKAALDPGVVAAKPWLKTAEGRAAGIGSKGRFGGNRRLSRPATQAGPGAAGTTTKADTTKAQQRKEPKATRGGLSNPLAGRPPAVYVGSELLYVTPAGAMVPFDEVALDGQNAANTNSSARRPVYTGTAKRTADEVELDDMFWYLPYRPSATIERIIPAEEYIAKLPAADRKRPVSVVERVVQRSGGTITVAVLAAAQDGWRTVEEAKRESGSTTGQSHAPSLSWEATRKQLALPDLDHTATACEALFDDLRRAQ